MTVANQVPRDEYLGNDSTATYSFNFRIDAESELLVKKQSTSGVETTLALTTDCTISSGAVAS